MIGQAEGTFETGVRVSAPARLHLGFLDLSGSLGRRFGSLGLSIERPATRIRARRAAMRRVSGPDAARAEAALLRIASALGLDPAIELVVESALPPHCGLGSGTQLGLAVGKALGVLSGHDLTPREIGRLLQRGQRSAIGIGTFESGGVILDGGRGERDDAPPIVCRMPVPSHWRILLIQDRARSGLSGKREVQAMAALAPFPDNLAGLLCRLVLMKALPALAEADCDAFGEAIGEMQRRLGDHFAPAQGGRYTSPAVAEVLAWAESRGITGVGQSSWGPTGFAIIGDPDHAEALAAEARERWAGHPGLAFDLVRGNNRGVALTAAMPFTEPELLEQQGSPSA